LGGSLSAHSRGAIFWAAYYGDCANKMGLFVSELSGKNINFWLQWLNCKAYVDWMILLIYRSKFTLHNLHIAVPLTWIFFHAGTPKAASALVLGKLSSTF